MDDDTKRRRLTLWILNHKKIVTICIIIAYLVTMLNSETLFKQNLEHAYYISQILSSVVVIGGLIVSVLQYTATNISNKEQRERERKVKAAEMAYKFQEELIPLMNILAQAYSSSKLDKTLLKKIQDTKLEMFNKEEVLKIVDEDEIVTCLYQLYAAHLAHNYTPEQIVKDEKSGKIESIRFSDNDKKLAEKEIDMCMMNLANKLEYFGICFNSEIADDDTVYQSLHGLFFNCVEMLYIFTFLDNDAESDRLFSNVSSLYIKWHKRYDSLLRKEHEELDKMKKDVKDKIVVKAKK